MNRETLIQKTLQALSKLPETKVNEVADFANYLLKKYDEEILRQGIQSLVSKSKTYTFLNDEEDLYTVNDLIEKYK